VTVHPGETWTCTFSNTTNRATIQVIKQVDGNQVAGWTVNASAPSAPMTVSPGSVTTVASGTSDFALSLVDEAGSSVHLAEVAQTGYTSGAVSCVREGSTTQTGTGGAVDVTVHPNETWTCTFSNTTNRATIQVIKNVDGAQAAGWTINATGPSAPMTVSPGSVVTSATATADFALSLVDAAGSSVHLAEVLQTGYTAGAVSCTAPNLTGQTGTTGAVDVTVHPGETWTCTFNNTTNTATIQVNKVWSGGVTGDQPTADLNIGTTGSGHEVNQTPVTGLANGSTGSQTVVTGPAYFVSESAVSAGWTAGSAACTRNGTGFSYDSTNGFSVAANDVVVCTFTNTRIAPVPQVTTQAPPTLGAPVVPPTVAPFAADVPPIVATITEIVPRPKHETVSVQEAVSRGGSGSAPRLAISLIVLLVLFAIVFRLPLLSVGGTARWRR